MLERAEDLDLDRVRQLFAERIPSIPRLRQRLVRVPPGCGGPIWVDDDHFDIRRHVRGVECPPPGDEDALLDAALSLVMTPLPRTEPLWSAALVTGLADGRAALLLVLHHVLADGVGGLAVLASLIDPGASASIAPFPRPRPAAVDLVRDVFSRRWRALAEAPRFWRMLRSSMSAGGGLHPPRIADCSLIARTGPRRRLAVVRADVDAVRAAAHRYGATTNDAVLVAVADALHRVLLGRGESVGSLVLTVPVSARRKASGSSLGNMVSPIIVPVPTTGTVDARLSAVAAEVRASKTAATGPPPIALLGRTFRALAALGGYHWYMNHQHRFHTLVSHLRGPDEILTFGGTTIASAVPIGVAEGGNATVYFEVLSYAGTVTISAVVDPDHFPDIDVLTDGLRRELDQIVHASARAQ
jgi:WS/DGAT/MGAT family acyltransferase